MPQFSVAVEGDKPLTAYPKLALKAETLGFHSFQIYEHLPYKPAWPLAFLAGIQTKKILVGPVTEPVFLHRPITLARNLTALSELTQGRAILGISRGAYSETLKEPVDRSMHAVLETAKAVRELTGKGPYASKTEIYVGTSGPKLAYRASCLEEVNGIVVDNLWNPKYASKLRNILDKAQSASRRRRRIRLIARPFTMLARNMDEALKKIDLILKSYLPDLIRDSPMLAAAGITYEQLQAAAQKKERLPGKLTANFAALGNTADILSQTKAILKAGVDEVCFGHPLGTNPVEVMRKISEDLLTQFN